MENGIHYYLYHSFKLSTTQEGFFDEINQTNGKKSPIVHCEICCSGLIVVPPEIKDSFLSNL